MASLDSKVSIYKETKKIKNVSKGLMVKGIAFKYISHTIYYQTTSFHNSSLNMKQIIKWYLRLLPNLFSLI
jgi:hypothetical protein